MKLPLSGLQFETNTICNARCTFCQHKNVKKRPAMKWSTILDILYFHAHKVQWICPFGMQEPLLEPRLSAILAAAKQFNPHVHTTVYSNMSIYPKETWKEIINLQTLDKLCVSFYGTTKKVYEKLQPPLDYYKVQRNIKKLAKLRRRMGWYKPQIEMHVLVTKETAPKANKFADKWKQIADKVGYVHYDSWAGKTEDWDNNYEEKVWKDATPHAPQRLPCSRLWTTMMINSDGTVVPCCLDSSAEENCGNISDDPQTWYNNPRLNELRHLHLEGRWDDIALCTNCSIWRRETPKWWIMKWKEMLKPAVYAVNP